MDVGEIIIKAKLAVDEFTDDLQDFVEEAKEKGRDAGTFLSNAFNKAVNFGKGLLGTIGKIATSFGRIIFNAGFLTTLLGSAGLGAISLAGAFKKIFEENEQIKVDIQYLIFAISKALEPAINTIANIIVKIINFLFKAVQYTAYLIKAWTGKDIFAGATMGAFADSMASAEKSSGGVAKNAKEINKQLAGFDEMNVLQDNASASGGGAGSGGVGGGGAMPSFDLSGEDIEPPKWLVWIKDHGKLVLEILKDIGIAILAIKFGLDLIQGLGIWLIIDGFVKLIKDLKKYLEDPTWRKFADVLSDIGEILIGTGLLAGITSTIGLALALVGEISFILSGVIKEVENIIDFIKDPSWDNFFNILKDIILLFGSAGFLSYNIIDMLTGWDRVKEDWEKIGAGINEYIIIPLTEAWEKIKEVFGVVKDWFETNVKKPIQDKFQQIWDKVVEIFSPAIGFFEELFGTITTNVGIMRDNIIVILSFLWEKAKEIFGVVKQWVDDHIITPLKAGYNVLKTFFLEKYDKAKAKIDELKNYFIAGFTIVKNKIMEIFGPLIGFFSNLWDRIKTTFSDFATRVGTVISTKIKEVLNKVIASIENILNTPINAINGLIDKIRKVAPGLQKLQKFSFPRLAKGGIINMPGRGVMVGSAIGGESGAEGVIPLTDSQQMELLGEAIGKHISVNNVVPVYLNGRQIAREVNISNAERDFAFNR